MKSAYYLTVVGSRVTHPHIIRQRAPVASHHFALSTARKLFSLKLLLRSSFECLCWWKPTRKLGAPKTIYSQHPLQKKHVGHLLGSPIFYAHWLYSFAQAKQWRHPTSAIFGSVRWRQASPGIEFSLELGGWFCHWSHMRLMDPTTIKPNNGSS